MNNVEFWCVILAEISVGMERGGRLIPEFLSIISILKYYHGPYAIKIILYFR